jgi:hypothetical protein
MSQDPLESSNLIKSPGGDPISTDFFSELVACYTLSETATQPSDVPTSADPVQLQLSNYVEDPIWPNSSISDIRKSYIPGLNKRAYRLSSQSSNLLAESRASEESVKEHSAASKSISPSSSNYLDKYLFDNEPPDLSNVDRFGFLINEEKLNEDEKSRYPQL